MDSATPKDHYIPQFYLDSFAIEGPGQKNPHVYQYMAENVVPARIKDVASKKNLDTFKNKSDGAPNREVNDFFTTVEGNAVNPISKILNNQNLNLSDEEFEHLSIFFATLIVRTPSFIRLQTSIEQEAIKLAASGVFLTDEEVYEYQQLAINKDYEISFANSRGYFLSKGLKIAINLANWYYQSKKWHLVVNKSRVPFITSDNPVLIYRPAFLPKSYNSGYGNGTLLISISPTLCLYLRDKNLNNSTFEVSMSRVEKINKDYIRFSDKYIYSNIKSKKIYDDFKSLKSDIYHKANITHIKNTPYVVLNTPTVPKEFKY